MVKKLQVFIGRYLLVSIILLDITGIVLIRPASVQAESVSSNQASENSGKGIFNKSAPGDKPERLNLFVYLEPSAKRDPVRNYASQHGGKVRYEYKAVMPNMINLRNMPVTALKGLRNIMGVIKVERDVYHPNLIKRQRFDNKCGSGLRWKRAVTGSCTGSHINWCQGYR